MGVQSCCGVYLGFNIYLLWLFLQGSDVRDVITANLYHSKPLPEESDHESDLRVHKSLLDQTNSSTLGTSLRKRKRTLRVPIPHTGKRSKAYRSQSLTSDSMDICSVKDSESTAQLDTSFLASSDTVTKSPVLSAADLLAQEFEQMLTLN